MTVVTGTLRATGAGATLVTVHAGDVLNLHLA
jgi:hypothetical protein